MKNKYNLHEVVKIISKNPKLNEVYGKEGVIVGVAQHEETLEWGYAVSIIDLNEVWDFRENDLVSLGRFLKKEDLYTNENIKVRIDPKTEPVTKIV